MIERKKASKIVSINYVYGMINQNVEFINFDRINKCEQILLS